MPDVIRTGVITGVGATGLWMRPTPRPAADEVLVRVGATAVCTWEQHVFTGVEQAELPFAGGHEVAGTVVATGSAVTGLEVGDRVAVGLAATCGRCHWCVTGRDRVCVDHLRGNVDVDGIRGPAGFADYKIHPAEAVCRVDAAPMAAAALVEPLSCAVHAAGLADVPFAADVLVLGAGVMGLLNVIALRLRGARVIAADLDPALGQAARAVRATAFVEAGAEHARADIARLTDGHGPDAVVVTAATASANRLAMDVVADRGTVVLFASAFPQQSLAVEPNRLHFHEQRLVGAVSADRADFHAAARLVRYGLVDLAPLVEASYGLTSLHQALAHASRPGTRRVVVVPEAPEDKDLRCDGVLR